MSFQVSCSHFASVVHIVDPGRRRGNGCVTLIQKGFKTEKSQVRKGKKIVNLNTLKLRATCDKKIITKATGCDETL